MIRSLEYASKQASKVNKMQSTTAQNEGDVLDNCLRSAGVERVLCMLDTAMLMQM